MTTEPTSHDRASDARPDDLARRLAHALVCSAAEPALNGVLLFDLDPRLMESVARLFAGLLAGGTEAVGAPLMLGSDSRDEDLWTRSRLLREADGITFRTEPGPLIEGDRRSGPPPVVVVPDLTRLSVAGMRAAVQLLGADVAVVERTGLRSVARPRTRWLASCRTEDVGRLSPHLLDRFAVRLPAAGLVPPRPESLMDELPPAWRTAAREGVPALPVADDALTRVRDLLGPEASARRELALARLARTIAAVGGAHRAEAWHADAAARLIGLAPPDAPDERESEPRPADASPSPTHPGATPSDAVRRPATVDRSRKRPPMPGEALLETEPAEGLGPALGAAPAVPATPYPEDEAEALRDFAPLRSPWQRRAGTVSPRGVVVGTRRARDLRDLALVRTVREAAVHQKARRTEQFTVLPVDLHSHIRAGTPERILVLVLDHTCRDDWDWQDALTPFLRWAYTERAAAQVVEIGGAHAADELRAEGFTARSVLDPRVMAALYRPAGRATPLAHGIDQAVQTLRRAFRQHGAGLAEAWLVVVTDGRGNVPLRTSRTGRLDGEVGGAGVEDALEAAAGVGAMDRTRLHVAVIDPAKEPYGDLPFALADALGASVIAGRATPDPAAGEGSAGER
ncbi:magnesium chelatase [Streptomyces sp. NPDC002619]|uniref:magnesium chelatase n=1 Tax=Streptomyces sp. NPDC002619 TaxID=3364655 RepID=UPI00369064F4